MGAAASIPDELTQEEAIKLAGDKWDEKLLALWPAGADKVTKDQLITIIKDVPIFAAKPDEAGNWDETAVSGQTKSIEEVLSSPDAVAPDASAKPAATKVVTATRDKHDMALRRAQKLAEQNNMTVEEVMAMQQKASGGAAESANSEPGEKTPAPKPPRAPGAKSKGRQQSEELRELMRAQRAAAKSEGRPPSRSVEDVQLFVRPASRGGASDAPAETQVFVCDGSDAEPQVLVVGPESDA